MGTFMSSMCGSCKKDDIEKLNDIEGKYNRLHDLIKDKINSLEKSDADYNQKLHKLNVMGRNAFMKMLSDQEDIVFEAKKIDFKQEGKSTNWIESMWNSRLKIRNDLLKKDKDLSDKEEKVFKGMDENKRSLVEDFANPNTEQPSYMDPDD